MDVQCPGCNEKVAVPDVAASRQCPRCQTPIPRSGQPEQATAELLAAVMQEVRQFEKLAAARAAEAPEPVEAAPVVRSEPKPAPVPEETAVKPGVFPKPSRSFYDRGIQWGKVAIVSAILATIIVGYLAVHAIRLRMIAQRSEVAVQRAEADLAPVKEALARADKLRAEKQYAAAKRLYQEGVFDTCNVLRDRLREETAGLNGGSVYARVQAVDKALSDCITQAADALKAPEIKFGAEGMVLYEGEWVTPERQKELFAAKMAAEGRQLYEGQWLTESEIHAAKGEVAYDGKWVTKEQYALLMAQAARPADPTPTPTPAPPRTRTRTGAYSPSDTRWVLDDFEGGTTLWRPAPWSEQQACPCTTAIEDWDGSKQLLISLQGGSADKAAVMRTLGLDIRSRSKLVLDGFNASDGLLQVAIALQTDKFYESRTQTLKKGANPRVTFNLRASDFKSDATKWVHSTRLGRPELAGTLFILIYSKDPGKLYLDNVVLLGD